MARARNIKPGFFSNDDLGECSPLTRLMFIGMWTMADRRGRMEDRPKKIKATTLPYDNADCDEMLSELEAHGFIIRYVVNGNKFIQIINWGKHQNPHVKEPESEIPEYCDNSVDSIEENLNTGDEPEKHSASTIQEQFSHDEDPADSGFLIPDSLNLIPDSSQKDFCSEQNEFAQEPKDSKQESPDSPTVMTILTNTGDEWPVTESLIDQMRDLYPAVNVTQEFRNISGWSLGNPKKRKTKSGMMRFITAWLSKAQNQGGGSVVSFQSAQQQRPQSNIAAAQQKAQEIMNKTGVTYDYNTVL